MNSENTLLINRFGTSSAGLCVHYDYEKRSSSWLLPGNFSDKRLSPELILLYFLIDKCDLFSDNHKDLFNVNLGIPLSKGFSDFLNFILLFDTPVINCMKFEVSETNYFSGVNRKFEPCQDEHNEDVAGETPKANRSVNLNVVGFMMQQIFNAISTASSSVDVNVPWPLIWTVFDSRKAFASGWPASNEGLASVALGLHEVFGLKLNMKNSCLDINTGNIGYNVGSEDLVQIAKFSSDPAYFLEVSDALDRLMSADGTVADVQSDHPTSLGDLLYSMTLGDRNKYRSGLACLPNGMEAILAVRLSQTVNFKNDYVSPDGERGGGVFWTPRGRARLGHQTSRLPRWRSVV